MCKVMLIIFWDSKGVVMRDFVSQGRGVNKEYYLATMKKLRESIRQHCPDMWRHQNFWLHHDGAPAHRADIVTDFLTDTNTKLLPHPPYSPDLAPSDFFLFARMKRNMRGIIFDDIQELKQCIDFKIGQIAQWEFAHVLHNSWNKRLAKCIQSEGNYFRL